jgi:hypothetical protein
VLYAGHPSVSQDVDRAENQLDIVLGSGHPPVHPRQHEYLVVDGDDPLDLGAIGLLGFKPIEPTLPRLVQSHCLDGTLAVGDPSDGSVRFEKRLSLLAPFRISSSTSRYSSASWLKSSQALGQARQPAAMPASPIEVPGEGPSTMVNSMSG